MPNVTRAQLVEWAILIPIAIGFIWLLNITEAFYPPAWQAMGRWALYAILVLTVTEYLLPKRLPWAKTAIRWVGNAAFLIGVIWPFVRYGLYGLILSIPDEVIRTGMRLLGQVVMFLPPWLMVYFMWRIARAIERK